MMPTGTKGRQNQKNTKDKETFQDVKRIFGGFSFVETYLNSSENMCNYILYFTV